MKKKSTFISYLVGGSLLLASAATISPLWLFAGY